MRGHSAAASSRARTAGRAGAPSTRGWPLQCRRAGDRSQRRPTTLYAGTVGGGVFKSTDGGQSWSAVNGGLTKRSVYTLAIDPHDPDHALCGDSWRRRLQEHGRRGELERRQHRPDQHALSWPWPSTPRPRDPLRGDAWRRRLQEHRRRRRPGAPSNTGLTGIYVDRPGHRSRTPDQPLRGDGRRRRLQEHQRRGRTGARATPASRTSRFHRAGHRSQHARPPSTRGRDAASSRAPTAGQAGAPSTPA